MGAGRRIRRFAAPLVVIAVSPACKKPEDSSRPRASDGGAVARATDAAVASTDKLMFFDSASGGCMTYPDRRTVECDGNPTVIFAWKTITTADGAVTYDTPSSTCRLQRAAASPQSNPPAPENVACPPELMPMLTGGATMTRQEGDACYWHDLAILCPGHLVFDDPACYQIDATGQRQYADCPPSVLPPAPKDDLVYAQGDLCFPIHASGGQGRVTCPPGGATVVLPTPTSKDLGGGSHIAFDTWNMSCRQWTDMQCPQNVSCNPPPPMAVECPPELLPKLANGEQPTAKKNGACYWNSYRVACK